MTGVQTCALPICHFTDDPDETMYNIYYKTSAQGESTKLNNEPIANSTNYLSKLKTNSNTYYFSIKSILNGVEKDEPGEFILPKSTIASRIVKDFDFEPLPAGHPSMIMKFCWPVDLNGDGVYDFVLDRQNYGETDEEADISASYTSPKIEAYSSEGKFMWRVDMGYNIMICNGHNDMVTAFDMDGDGKAEVLMAVSEGTTFADGKVVTDSKGNVNNYSTRVGCAPQWISVVNGETGVEMDRIELPYFDELKGDRTDKWKNMNGHFIIAYLDGITPSLIYQYKTRHNNGWFYGAYSAFDYKNGKLSVKWSTKAPSNTAEFHQVRVGDVDGDGCDEFVEGGFVLNNDGTVLNRHEGVIHGDRHTLADIDPDNPGLEHFFIQQENPTTLGMGIADAKTGKLITGLYQSSVYDVGRGVCAAADTTLRGMQFWSMMNGFKMYDAFGKPTGGTGAYPSEPLWWGPGLSRYHCARSDGNGYNLTIENYNTSSKSFGRAYSIYNENNGKGSYYFKGAYGGRAAFWGDLFGDWREELICCRRDDSGFVILSTWDVTDVRLYTLMQNQAYRCQVTAKGYYQTSDVDYYMAHDMPKPPVAPVLKADIYYSGNGTWIDYNDNQASYSDGKTIMFDLRGCQGASQSEYVLNSDIAPSSVLLMNPKDKNYIFSGSGKMTGTMSLLKSMQGTVTFRGNHNYTGITRISEGKLILNGKVPGKVRVDARGVLGGNAILEGGVIMEKGLNIEGGRLEPGTDTEMGIITIKGDLVFPDRNNIAIKVNQSTTAVCDKVIIEGDFIVSGQNNSIIINAKSDLKAGEIIPISFTGVTNATADNFKIKGIDGTPYNIIIGEKEIKIEIRDSRSATEIFWSGEVNSIWDYKTLNFKNNTVSDNFVPGDAVRFNDDSENKNIVIEENVYVSDMTFDNNTNYILKGNGIVDGNGSLKKTGTGKLTIELENNTFSGGVDITDGILEVTSLKNGGLASSIGMSSNSSNNWIMRNATFIAKGQMATDRNMKVQGKLTVNNSSGNSVMISGNISKFDSNNISLEQKGSGTLSLQGTNGFSEVTVSGGMLFLSTPEANSNSLGSAKVYLKGGTLKLFDINSSSFRGPFANELNIPEGCKGRIEIPSRWNITSKVTGSGDLEFYSPYIRGDINGDWREFNGSVAFSGRDIRINSANSRNLSKAEVILKAGTYLHVASDNGAEVSTSNTFTLGALSGEGSISGRNSLIIGDKNINSTYSGSISSGSGKLTKRGEATLTLSGSNNYTGGTVVENGTLIISNTQGSATGTSSVVVKGNGILKGSGIIGGTVSIQSGGIIQPGKDDKTISNLTINSDLNIEKDGILSIKFKTIVADKIIAKKGIKLAGKLEMKEMAYTKIAAGMEFIILSTDDKITGEFSEIIPAVPAQGLKWDVSRINEGIIAIVESAEVNGIKDVNNESVKLYPTVVRNSCFVYNDSFEILDIDVFNVSGAKVKNLRSQINETVTEIDMQDFPKGIYFVTIKKGNKPDRYQIIKE